jgi:hypothetical protein
LTVGQELTVSYDFNKPTTTWANTGNGGTGLSTTSTVVLAAGNPAKSRGIYFDGTNDGYVQIPGLLLSHSFSVHAWVFIKESPITSDLTLFSKDRGDAAFTPSTNRYQLRLSIDGAGGTDKMTAELAQDISVANYVKKQSTSAVLPDAWTYLVYSFDLTTASTKTVAFFVNNVADGTQVYTGVFHIDHSDYKSFIGIERTTSATVFGNRWNGFIHDFHIYQAKHTTANTAHSAAGCSSGCLSDVFMNWNDGST